MTLFSTLTLHTLLQSILQYNGGAVIAMAGNNCVGICRYDRDYLIVWMQLNLLSCDILVT